MPKNAKSGSSSEIQQLNFFSEEDTDNEKKSDEELTKEYGAEGLTVCPRHAPGQVMYADFGKPEGMCDEAWKAIYQYVFALAHGGGQELFYRGNWIRKPGVAICSCNDGLRPVIFKLEATDEVVE